jgi:hypothetical protein
MKRKEATKSPQLHVYTGHQPDHLSRGISIPNNIYSARQTIFQALLITLVNRAVPYELR